MIHQDPVLMHELPAIRKIIEDETWLEGERRGCKVQPDDHVVRERVCEVILRIGQQLRDSASSVTTTQGSSEPCSVTTVPHTSRFNASA